ncbi:UDP-glucose--hexose-1-phosphate uridylyltransferase [uncultured Flavonifractor sp.]|uniref:UDP-glucose--hexose-1-phosphate uridylyltransferase n=1 Tax=uncultured Flavonifractor sp. TaxID=1193534 RepID=UPI00262A4931|nr:UDP-glucose--hexose-1-phosphate uridylyltransferase [uncultured Flavonifractor sp.]
MEREEAIAKLVAYGVEKELIQPEDRVWAVNTLLDVLGLSSCALPEVSAPAEGELPEILGALADDAHARGVLPEDSVTYRDLFDTRLMGVLTPRPSQVIAKFRALCEQDPKAATDWYYKFSQDTNYIRRDRIAKDVQWKAQTEYGELDITINLSKPEKDPKAIAAARNLPASAYPRCQLCAENEGYAGRLDHPARENHRIVPITINGSPWFLQYSPYVYYNEHCICLNKVHTPMKIDRACFAKLLDFVGQFPHYFVGSNADLPIVGGSILAHDHFQGGRYTFAMEKAPVETPFTFPGYEDVAAGIVKWPMSVVRLTCGDPQRLIDLADKTLASWRGYTDEAAMVLAETDGEPHNTITPIARRRGKDYELDLVLRNNLTTEEHPLGLYHPHAELHHIKKENIGLIEVMGLAVLPARLKTELAAVADKLASGGDLRADPLTAAHADWAEGFAPNYTITADNALDVVYHETGLVFAKVLEHAGVYARTPEGKEAFLRFLEQV